ncbi:MAG: hypothetical protein MSA76_09910 [Clostridium sp.]|nr:hypothetical protein [Clostridium sp.]
MSEVSELTKALQEATKAMREVTRAMREATKELSANRKSVESLKEIFSKLGTGYCSAVPVDSGLTGNQVRQLYNLKKIEEQMADKVIISSRLYNMLIQADSSPAQLVPEECTQVDDKPTEA